MAARPAPAAGDEARQLRASLSYDAPAACPAEARFTEQLGRHSAVVLDAGAQTRLVVTIERRGKRYHGSVAVGGHAEYGEREVVADRCEDVARGLALFSAIALDAFFDNEAADAPAPVEPAPPPPPQAARRRPSPGARQAPSTRPPPSPPGHAWWLGALVGQQGGAGPLVTELGLGAQLALTGGLRSSFALSAHIGQDLPRSYGDGSLTFRLGWLRLDACPLGLGAGRATTLSACVLGDLGVQRAALDGDTAGRAQVEPWAALGAAGRLRTQVGRSEVQLSAGALAPLLPLDFSTRRSGVVYSTPALAPMIELGLFFQLP